MAIPKGFLPSEDQGQLFAFTEGIQGISFEEMVRHQKEAARIVGESPYVANYMSTVGGGGVNAALNSGRIFARLTDRKTRPHVDKIIEELRPKLMQIPGINVYLQNLPPIRIGGQLTKSQYQFTLQSPDTNELYQNAPKLEQRLRGLPQLQDVTSDLQIKNPQVTVNIDRDKAAALNVDPRSAGRRALQRLRVAPDLHHLRAQQPIQSHHGAGAAIPARSFRAEHAVCPLQDRTARAHGRAGQLQERSRTADRHAPGPASGGDRELQPEAGRGAGRRHQRRQSRGGAGPAADHHHQPARHGAGVSVVIRRPGTAAADGHPGHLYRAGNSVRELYPSHHHSFRTALGRRGRAAHAQALPYRAEHLRVCGRDHAGWAGKEKRHHDDRFCPGRAA